MTIAAWFKEAIRGLQGKTGQKKKDPSTRTPRTSKTPPHNAMDTFINS